MGRESGADDPGDGSCKERADYLDVYKRQDLVNDLYVLEKSRAYVIDSPYLDTAEKTLGAVLKRIIGGDDYCAEDGGEISALFAPLEGKQEYYWEQYLKELGKCASPEEDTDEELFIVDRLLSGSFAASLKREPDGGKAVSYTQLDVDKRQIYGVFPQDVGTVRD